jgi:hypothetical protein
MPMMETAIISSMSVNPKCFRDLRGIVGLPPSWKYSLDIFVIQQGSKNWGGHPGRPA